MNLKAEKQRLRAMCPAPLHKALEAYFEETGRRLCESLGFVEIMLKWSRSFPSFFDKFWPGIYHVTTVEGWRLIQDSGEIKPSSIELRGNRPWKLYYAEKRGAIALFDFGTFPKEKLFRVALGFRSTFYAVNPDEPTPSIWLHLDRSKLPGEVDTLDYESHRGAPLFLPYFEAHHIGPAPLSSVTAVSHVAWKRKTFSVISYRRFGQSITKSPIPDLQDFEEE